MLSNKHYSWLDRCVIEFDKSLKTIWGNPETQRPTPAASVSEAELSKTERRHSAGLMRVNHAGEVSAQALYQAQAITARSPQIRNAMHKSAQEENDHLVWCKQRLSELAAQPSYLNPVWYAGSFLIGLTAGFASDALSLGFVAETERQVVKHLEEHLKSLPSSDEKSRKILEQMREDETYHGTVAITAGAAELPSFIKTAMRLVSKVMTRSAYWV